MKLPENLYPFLWMNPTANNCNTYLIQGVGNILIDPGHRHLFGHVRDELARLSLSQDDMDMVLITHGHPDHMEAISLFAGTGTTIAMFGAEVDFIRYEAPHYGEALGIPDFEPDVLLREGDLHVGGLSFQVIHAPGHSPGAFCLYWPDRKALFTGDVVFEQGIGRTDLPGGSGQQLKESIERLSRLDVEYLLPGHGNMVVGRDAVRRNFEAIEQVWFAYL